MINLTRNIFLLVLLLVNQRLINAQTYGSFTFEGQNRTYIGYIPASYSDEIPTPLLLVSHGFTQSAQTIMQYSNFNSLAEEHNFIVVYPNGIGNSWNVGQGGGSSANDVGFLNALIDTIDYHYNIDLQRIYSSGFSNGGFMSYRIACELSDRVAAIGSVAGTMASSAAGSCNPERSIPIIHIHGTADFIVSYNGGFGNMSVNQLLGFWTANNNCPSLPEVVELPDLVQEGSTVEKHIYAPCDDQTEVVHLKVINGGHTWPGAVGNSGIGNTNMDISGSSEIWSFVSRFTNPMVTTSDTFMNRDIVIFPNPVISNRFRLNNLKGGTRIDIQLFSMDGRLILQQQYTVSTNTLEVDLCNLQSGIYVLYITNMGQSMKTKLVIL